MVYGWPPSLAVMPIKQGCCHSMDLEPKNDLSLLSHFPMNYWHNKKNLFRTICNNNLVTFWVSVYNSRQANNKERQLIFKNYYWTLINFWFYEKCQKNKLSDAFSLILGKIRKYSKIVQPKHEQGINHSELSQSGNKYNTVSLYLGWLLRCTSCVGLRRLWNCAPYSIHEH